MSKLRSDSAWSNLTAEQRDALEGWLFEENISYQEALGRAHKEFGVTASLRSLAEYYRRLARERAHRELVSVQETARELDGVDSDLEELGAAAMTLVAKRMIQLAVESPGRVKELVSLGRILVANDSQEIKRQWLLLEQSRTRLELQKEIAQQKKNAEFAAQMREMLFQPTPPASRPTDAKTPAGAK